jgi:hyaluronoglucosaminidase
MKKIIFVLFFIFSFGEVFSMENNIIPAPYSLKYRNRILQLKNIYLISDFNDERIFNLAEKIFPEIKISKNFLGKELFTVIYLSNSQNQEVKNYLKIFESNFSNFNLLGEEGYFILVKNYKNKNIIICMANNLEGIFYSLQTLNQLIYKEKDKYYLRELEIIDFPYFKIRGVIEGFYGEPWSHQDRINLMNFFGRFKINAYIYAPKDDLKHRQNWREYYNDEELKKFKELIKSARENFVNICYAISPGNSIIYSSEEDFKILCNKLDYIYNLGIRWFGLFLDDIPFSLIAEEDKKNFKTIASAQVHLTNKLYEYLKEKDENIKLILCPTVYFTKDAMVKSKKAYLKFLGKNIVKEVEIFWTGEEVCSKKIDCEDANIFKELIGRNPIIWDNYPVNDYIKRLYLGPLRNRDPKLYTCTNGIFSNPMNQADANKIPLCSFADYLWNPLEYNPEKSYEKTLKKFAEEKYFSLLKSLTDDFYTWIDEKVEIKDKEKYLKAEEIVKNSDNLELYKIIKSINSFVLKEEK